MFIHAPGLQLRLFRVTTWYKITMVMLFSFKHIKDPKDQKSEEEYEAIAVKGAMQLKNSNLMPRTG